MKCSNCGEELSARAPYCGLCGTYAPGYEDWGDREVSGGPENNFSANNYHAEYFDENSAYNDWESNNARGLAIPGDERDTHRPRQSEIYADPDAETIDMSKYDNAVIALLGNSADDYMERFKNNSVFNIWGLFFGPTWYAYRRMLDKAVLFSLLAFIPIIGQIICIYYLFTGDKQYRKHIDTNARELLKFEEGSKEWKDYVAHYGGASLFSIFFYWIIASVLSTIISMFLSIFM